MQSTMFTAGEKPSLPARLIAVLVTGCMCLPGADRAVAAAAVTAPSQIAREAETRVRLALGAAPAGAGQMTPLLDVRAQLPDPRLRLGQCTEPLESRVETSRPEQGRALVRVTCRRPAWSLFVPVNVETEAEVLVAARVLARGSAVSPSDVRLERRRFPGVTENYVNSPAELSRYRLRRPVTSGALLSRDALELAPVVQRGSLVTLRAEAGGFKVDAAGRALADAAPGQRVRVQNATSLKVVEGVVDDSGIVRLDP